MKTVLQILVGLVLLVTGCQQKPLEPKQIYDKYRNSVVLVCTKYYHTIDFGNGLKFYYVSHGDDEPPGLYIKENEAIENAGIAFGTGFFIGREGQVATNRHVIEPEVERESVIRFISGKMTSIRNEFNQKLIEKYNTLNKIRNYYQENVSSLDANALNEVRSSYTANENEILGLNKAISLLDVDPQNIRIHTEVIDIGVAYDNTWVTSFNDFKSSVVIRSSGVEKIDLAIIQLKEKRTPEYIKDIFSLETTETVKAARMAINDDLYMIGFNEGLELAQTRQGIKSQLTIGKLTQEPDDSRILYSIPTLHGSSGSPVIDRCGNLVAINFAKVSNTQGFNFGIPVQYLADLVKTPAHQPQQEQASRPTTPPPATSVMPTSEVPHDGREEIRKSSITGFVRAEDARDFDRMASYMTPQLSRYWDLQKPGREDVKKQLDYLWYITSNSKNIIREIRPISEDIYDLYTEYEYFDLRLKKTISKSSRVRFHFTADGRIDEIYGVQ